MTFITILRQRLAELGEAREAAVAELEAVTATAEAESRSALTDEETARFDEVRQTIAGIDNEITEAEARLAELEAIEERRNAALDAAKPDAPRRNGRDPFDVRDVSVGAPVSELRSRALSAVEETEGDLDDEHRARATELLERHDHHGVIARRILATGSVAYRTAFQKVAAGLPHLLDNDERQALARAMSLTDAEGGYAVPYVVDPTIILTNDGAANPFRALARVESIATDKWAGLSSAGVSGGYAGEATEVGDDSATIGNPEVPVHRWDVFVPFSFEIGQDWSNLEANVRLMVAEKRDEFDAVAFTTGSGNDAPTGIITALTGGSSVVSPATAETFAPEDLYAVEEALPPKYRLTAAQAAWMMALGTIQTIRQFAQNDGPDLIARLGAGAPPELLGYRLAENSAMRAATAINPAATAANYIAVLGDWRNYLIADRVGMNMELVPHLFGANQRPTGERGFLAWGRTGADSVNDNAFRVLNVPTTA